ncbi:MAG: hypothetical protein JXR94_06805, partial [Candidatus Hydrogenedentes bacterium]|nr:hypothetical protein [Candidatus Hydrogenedentota bacterium]
MARVLRPCAVRACACALIPAYWWLLTGRSPSALLAIPLLLAVSHRIVLLLMVLAALSVPLLSWVSAAALYAAYLAVQLALVAL